MEKTDKEINEVTERWRRDEDRRSEILRIQHEEALFLHEQFEARNARLNAVEEARLRDHLSVVVHRDQVNAAIDKQTAILERIAAALEKRP